MSAPVLFGLCAVLVIVAVLGRGPRVAVDEAWFVQVLLRMRRGDVLYRDVFFGVGPIAPWLGLAAFRIGGDEARVLRLVDAVYFTITLALSWWMVDLAGGGVWLFVGLVVASIGLSGPGWRVETYGELSRVFGLATVACLLQWGGAPSSLWPALAGAAAALAFLTKQNIGVVDLVGGALLVIAVTPGPAPVVAFIVSAAIAGALGLAPLLAQGALRDYWRRGFRNKTSYLESGRLGLVTGFGQAWPRAGHPARRLAVSVVVLYSYLGVVVALLTVAITVAAVAGESVGLLPGAVALVAALVFASSLFRSDLAHVQSALPLVVLGAALAAQVVRVEWNADPTPGLIAVLLVGGVLGLAIPAQASWRRWAASDSSEVPHLGGLTIPQRLAPDLVSGARALRELTGGRVFVLRPDAAFWYVAADLENPTPFDYPLASTFGPHGQQDVVEAIADGSLEWICFPGPTDGALRPKTLEAYVASELERVADTAAGPVLTSR